MVYVDLRALHPLIHRMELFSSAKLIIVRMTDITLEYFSSLFSAIFSRRFSSSLIDHRGCASARVLQSEDLCLPVAQIFSLTLRSRRDGFLGSLCLVLLT